MNRYGQGKWEKPQSDAEADETVKGQLQRFGRYIDKDLPYGWGFVLLCFPYGPEGRMNYIANAERADVVRAMYEFIAATKAGWGEHVPAEAEPGSQMGDELIGRLRQQIAALEEENRALRERYGTTP